MQRNVAVSVGVLILVGIGAFGVVRLVSLHGPSATAFVAAKPTTCADAYRVLKLRPSQIASANPVCLNQSLQLTGEVIGAVGQAYPVDADSVAPTQMCSVPKRWDGFPTALLALVAGGKGYRLRISAPGSSEHQAVTINNLAGVVELDSISNPSQRWNQATGSLTLNADAITGSIDADVVRDVSGAAPVHINGRWACGALLPLPVFDASAPCANFYALNHLRDADVARMKASACNLVSLVFSGDIRGQVDHAITDRGILPHTGIDGDNVCDVGNGNFAASLKFSIGDESFLLDLSLSLGPYQSVGPGQYSAAPSVNSPGPYLWLGHADPDNQGVFTADEHVFWAATAGTFTIAPDMKSGTIDATLGGFLDHASSRVQVKGSWRCGA